MDHTIPARPALPTAKELSLSRGRSPAQILAVIASTTTLLVAVLGCGVASTLVNKPPSDPTATPPAISTHEVAQTTSLIGGQTGPVVATCPQGEIALSGGWNIPSTGARVFAAMVTNNGWAVYVSHPGPTINPGAAVSGSVTQLAPTVAPPVPGITVTAYVECLRGATGTVLTQRATTKAIAPTVSSDAVDNASVYIGTCQPTEGLVGFGFDFGASGADQLELEASVPSEVLHTITWSFRVWNYDTVAHDVTFDLECATTTAHGAVTYPAQQGTVLYASMTGSAVALCPSGTMVAGGGFNYTLRGARSGTIGNEYSHNATPTGWQSSLIAFTSYGLVAIAPEAIAVCLSLT